MELKINLTEAELKVLKQDLRGEFYPMTATDEEFEALNSVIAKASKLEEELDAYEEINGNLLQWFYDKFLAFNKQKSN